MLMGLPFCTDPKGLGNPMAALLFCGECIGTPAPPPKHDVVTGVAIEVGVMSTAAAATVEHPGVLRVSTDSTSANGVLFSGLATLLLPPDRSQDTEDEGVCGERPWPVRCAIYRLI